MISTKLLLMGTVTGKMPMRKRENLVLIFDNSNDDMELIDRATHSIANRLGYSVPNVRIMSMPDFLPKFKELGLLGADNELENKIEFIINDFIELRKRHSRPRLFVLPNYVFFGDENTEQVFHAYSMFASNSYFKDTDTCNFIGYYGNLLDTTKSNDCVNRFELFEMPEVGKYFSYLPRLYYLLFGEERRVLEHVREFLSKYK